MDISTITTLNHVSAVAAPIAYTVLRVGTGAFFAISGAHKLFSASRHATLVATLKACRIPYLPVMQWFVPGVEFSAGLAVTAGLLTPLAAMGLFAICVVATLTDGLGRIPAWRPMDRADYADDVLYLPEVIYAAILAMLIVTGAGPYSLDAIATAYIGG